MGFPVARLNDNCFGTCYAHTTPVVQTGILLGNASTVLVNGLPCGQLTNTVLGNDGHVGIIISSSGTVNANGLGVAYLGCNFVGSFIGTIIAGSGNVNTGL